MAKIVKKERRAKRGASKKGKKAKRAKKGRHEKVSDKEKEEVMKKLRALGYM